MKRIISFSVAFILLLMYAIPVFAADGHDPRVVDNAELLSQSEIQELTEKLDEISERQQLDVVVVTTNTIDGKSPMAYADDYYDYHNYGYGEGKDGVLLLLSMEDRDWWISTTGYGITAFTDAGIQLIGNEIVQYLSTGDYFAGFKLFADEADKFITQARKGQPYDVGSLPKEKKKFFDLKSALISLAIAAVIALVVVLSIKSKYKPVKFKANASDYLVQDSFNLTGAFDNFLYSNVSKTARSDDSSSSGGSSTHSGSSGTSHGGGGGKF